MNKTSAKKIIAKHRDKQQNSVLTSKRFSQHSIEKRAKKDVSKIFRKVVRNKLA